MSHRAVRTRRRSRRASVLVAGAGLTAVAGGMVPFITTNSANSAPSASRLPSVASGSLHEHPVGRQPKPTGSVELTWAPTYMQRGPLFVTPSQAVVLARRFDLIASLPITFRGDIAAMKEANPDLSVLAYANSTFLSVHRPAPAADYAHDLHGHLVRSTGFLTDLMDPGKASWRDLATSICSTAAAGGYDGCLLDTMTNAIFAPHYVSALPVDVATGKPYTQTEWRSALIALAHAYEQNLPHKIIIGNAVSSSSRFYDASPLTPSSQPVVAALPGAQLEDFLRGATDGYSAFPTKHQWLQNIRVIRAIEKSGRTGLFSTKVWPSPSQAVAAHWDAYAMASFLLEANGHSYFAFTDSRTEKGTVGKPPYTMPRRLGQPTSRVKHRGRLYLRHFRHGKVIVNPGARPAHVRLGRTFTDLQGHRVRSLTIRARSGNVLLRPAHH